jgi:N-acetylglucosamine-6-phosphate deacetylase
MIIEASTVLTPDITHEPGWIELTGTQITAVGSGKPPTAANFRVETLAPGFIDAHIHGGGGYSFNDPDPQAAHHIADTHLQHGTTTMLASLVTAPLDELVPIVTRLSEKVQDGVIAGVHLEGPWLSPDHRGAHDPALL